MSINSDISDSDNDDDNNQVENDENICDIQADLERSTFFVNYLSFVYHLTIVRGAPSNTFSVSIDNSHDESVLEWFGIKLAHYEQLHMLSRILPMLPDKIATARQIAAENIEGDSGVFLLVLVNNLYSRTVDDIIQKHYPDSFIESVVALQTTFRDIITSFEEFHINEQMISEFLFDCQPVLNALYLFLDWAHSQLINLHRTGEFSPEVYNSLRTLCLNKFPKTLILEYSQLTELENE